jgi:hypothetical protein
MLPLPCRMANGKLIPVAFREPQPLDPLDRAALHLQLRIVRLNREADRIGVELDQLCAALKPGRPAILRRTAGN